MNIKELEQGKCTGCGACYNICPHKAISMQMNREGFLSPEIDETKCVDCGLCYNKCPAEHPIYINNEKPMCLALAAEDDLRKQSSSGAVFPLLAELVLDNGGYVCGASWNEQNLVEHIIISDKADLNKLKGSKYLQSNTNECYTKIKSLLKKDKIVMFTGTPCQVAGLNAYLGKTYEKLLTVDIICHGTPSPKVYKKYLSELVQNAEEKVLETNFRDKVNGWKPHLTITTTTATTTYTDSSEKDIFMQAFLKNLCLNKSCAQCPFAKLPRQGDITLGDFWGIDKYSKKLNDKKGTSAVLINTSKGKKYINALKKKAKIFAKVPLKYAIKGNPCLIKPSIPHSERTNFFARLNNTSLADNVNITLGKKYDCGILNFWYCSNYGAMLTCYALQETIKSFGKNPKVINYIPPFQIKRFKNSIADKFSAKYLSLTTCCTNKKELQILNEQTDTFIVGSDQIWRYIYFWPNGDNIFQLNFVNNDKKKIAYAASFGTDSFEGNYSDIMKTKYYMQQFDNISVREDDGVDICSKTFGVKATYVLDPVFLADTKLWDDMVNGISLTKGTFIASYVLDRNEKSNNILNQVKKCFSGIDSIDMTDGMKGENISIENWIYTIKNCQFFITDSFHGACFAIIFNKPFICIANKSRGYSRFKSLFKLFGIEQRSVVDNNENIEDIVSQKIDYQKINTIKEKEVERSKKWLSDAINAEKSEYTQSENYTIIEQLYSEISELKGDIARINYQKSKRQYKWYRFLSKICFGKKRRKYKEKSKKLKMKMKELKHIYYA
ncbi:MAG: polysaccharide pyruvyl transferase family protein [Acetobacter sp.]|nr:polysaccharide pyruvyl transferase family protein [Acetobacter sp.]